MARPGKRAGPGSPSPRSAVPSAVPAAPWAWPGWSPLLLGVPLTCASFFFLPPGPDARSCGREGAAAGAGRRLGWCHCLSLPPGNAACSRARQKGEQLRSRKRGTGWAGRSPEPGQPHSAQMHTFIHLQQTRIHLDRPCQALCRTWARVGEGVEGGHSLRSSDLGPNLAPAFSWLPGQETFTCLCLTLPSAIHLCIFIHSIRAARVY